MLSLAVAVPAAKSDLQHIDCEKFDWKEIYENKFDSRILVLIFEPGRLYSNLFVDSGSRLHRWWAKIVGGLTKNTLIKSSSGQDRFSESVSTSLVVAELRLERPEAKRATARRLAT